MLIKNIFCKINQVDYHCRMILPMHYSNKQLHIVMLHQGLGSIAQWKLFPERLYQATQLPILMYERTGYGETGTLNDILPENFLFFEAYEILPKILAHFDINHYFLFGHSDGATISLLYASTKPAGLKGIMALTPHVFVEEITKQGIQKLITNYDKGILSYFLKKYHYEKTDVLFKRWTQLWLNEPLLSWNMFDKLMQIEVPVFTIQGTNDEFGTLQQLQHIAKYCPTPTIHYIIEKGRHNPHLEFPSIVVDKTKKAISM